MKKEVNMLSGPITKGILAISIPIMVMNVIQSLFNIIDMSILKNYGNDNGLSVGAVGTCGVLITLITGLLIGLSTGANVAIAKRIGRNNREEVEKAVGCALLIAVTGGLLLTVIGVSAAPLFLRWTNCPEELFDQAVLYFRLYFAGVPILMVYNFCASILRSVGDTGRPMIYLTVGGVVKVVFTYVFVAFCDMGVEGVAYATILSWSVSAIWALLSLARGERIVKIRWSKVRFYLRECKEMLRVGVPAGLQQALYSVANVIITATVNTFGPEATTGISIANNFDGILYQISVAPSLAVLSYVSQNVGKGNIKRATQSVARGMGVTVCLGALFGILSAVFSAELSSLMSDSPAVIAFSRQKMMVISSTYFICGMNEIMGAALRGLGRPTVATVSTLIYMCALRFVWVYGVFPLMPTLSFLYLVWPIGWTLSLISLAFVYFPTVKKRDREAKASAEGSPI